MNDIILPANSPEVVDAIPRILNKVSLDERRRLLDAFWRLASRPSEFFGETAELFKKYDEIVGGADDRPQRYGKNVQLLRIVRRLDEMAGTPEQRAALRELNYYLNVEPAADYDAKIIALVRDIEAGYARGRTPRGKYSEIEIKTGRALIGGKTAPNKPPSTLGEIYEWYEITRPMEYEGDDNKKLLVPFVIVYREEIICNKRGRVNWWILLLVAFVVIIVLIIVFNNEWVMKKIIDNLEFY